MVRIICTLTIAFMASGFGGYAQKDADGCKDHPMVGRMKEFYISECLTNYGALELYLKDDSDMEVREGDKTHLFYSHDNDAYPKLPSWLAVRKNYENALSAKGWKKVYDDNTNQVSFHFKSNGKEAWMLLKRSGGSVSEVEEYIVDIVEKAKMEQEVTASTMLTALEKEGRVALYINFETSKAEILPESMAIVDQIATMLKENADLRISVEGHTDNTGNAASNQVLSEKRASAVGNALISKGIEKTRLATKGLGSSKPLADNSTEEGKTKNRRVEIVKL